MSKELKQCPFCGGEVELIKFYETVDGRGDKLPKIKCKCGLEMSLTFEEFYKIRDDFNYTGGYYSSNKELWNEMHQRLVDKWNTRKPIDNIVEQLEELKPESECFDYEEDYIYAEKRHNRYIEIVKGGVVNES